MGVDGIVENARSSDGEDPTASPICPGCPECGMVRAIESTARS
jgi:pyruvate/2-oxoacid:ferredoxin oxidoreductase beta subunit